MSPCAVPGAMTRRSGASGALPADSSVIFGTAVAAAPEGAAATVSVPAASMSTQETAANRRIGRCYGLSGPEHGHPLGARELEVDPQRVADRERAGVALDQPRVEPRPFVEFDERDHA